MGVAKHFAACVNLPPKLLILDETLFAPQTLLFINEVGDQDMVVYPFDYLAY